MPITMSTALKNTILDGFDSAFDSATLEIRSGSAPGAGNTATGTVLATITTPADAFAAASSGTKAKAGTWSDSSADATGTAGHFRMTKGSAVIEGTVTATGGGGDIELDSTSITSGQVVTITSLAWSV